MENPSPPAPKLADPRRWLILVAIAALVGLWAATRGGTTRNGAGLPCLVHSDCARGLRCYVVPNPDGFATKGVCVETCLDDEQCGPDRRCAVTAEGSEQLVPVAVGKSPGERVCLRDLRKGREKE